MSVLFAIYVLLGPVLWIGVVLVTITARVRMNRLHASRATLPTPAPTLSLVVPAKDEATGLRDCVTRVLGQDYPGAEIAVIDDRSTDGTGAILDAIAAEDARVRATHVTELPAGWLGKCHALHVGTRSIESDWLLFVDSDVQLAPDAARRAVALCVEREYDVLSIMPRLDARSFWERSLLPLMAIAWGAAFGISMTNDDSRPDHAFANGQFFLIRREWYEKVGGHAAVRDQIVEDVALMRVLKQAGARTRLMFGGQVARTRMHTNLRQMFHGWARIFAGSSGRRIAPIVGTIAFMLMTVATLAVGATMAIATGHAAWIAATATHGALLLAYLAWAYAAAGQSPIYALAMPVTWPMVIAMLAYAIHVCRTGTVVWRGSAVGVGRHVGATEDAEI